VALNRLAMLLHSGRDRSLFGERPHEVVSRCTHRQHIELLPLTRGAEHARALADCLGEPLAQRREVLTWL
jgi:hypothetical protein